MDNSKMLDRLNEMEAHLQLLQLSVATLKEELQGSGAPKGSARKGGLPESERARIKARYRKNRLK